MYCLHTQTGWKPHCVNTRKHLCIKQVSNTTWTNKTKGEKGLLLRSLNCNWVTAWCARCASLLCQVHPQVWGNNRLGWRCGAVICWQIGVGVWWKITHAQVCLSQGNAENHVCEVSGSNRENRAWHVLACSCSLSSDRETHFPCVTDWSLVCRVYEKMDLAWVILRCWSSESSGGSEVVFLCVAVLYSQSFLHTNLVEMGHQNSCREMWDNSTDSRQRKDRM